MKGTSSTDAVTITRVGRSIQEWQGQKFVYNKRNVQSWAYKPFLGSKTKITKDPF